MSNCIDQILCTQSSECTVAITDENGNELDTRLLHSDDIIYLNISERVGYTFNGFTYKPIDGEPYPIYPSDEGNGRYRMRVICGGTYIANYSVNTYTLNVIPDSPSHGTTSGTGRYQYNTLVEISATENDGVHFRGWYINDTLVSTDINYTYLVLSDAYIVAKYEGDNYSIISKPNDSLLGSTTGSGIYEYDTDVELSATPFEGSSFLMWDDEEEDATRNITVEGNRIYTAIFTKNRYKVNVIINNMSSNRPNDVCGVVTGQGEYPYGTRVTLYASPEVGFSFVEWNYNGVTSSESAYSFNVTGNTTIIASFNDAMYQLTLNAVPSNGGYTTNGISNVPFNGGTYAYGTVVTTQAIPNSGYDFNQWDDRSLDTVRSFTMDHNITRTAYFVKGIPQYTLKILFDENKGNVRILNGTTDVSNYSSGYVYATVQEGTTLTAIVTELNSYLFQGWDDGSSEAMNRMFVMTDNITREVYFSAESMRTLCICSGFGWEYGTLKGYYGEEEETLTIDNRCVTVPNGTIVTVEYTPVNENYGLLDWVTSGLNGMSYTVNGNEITVNVTNDGEICALFGRVKATIGVQNVPSNVLANQIEFTITINGETTVTKTPNNNTLYTDPITIYPANTTYRVEVSTPTISGYEFVNITGNNGSQSFGLDYIEGALTHDIVFTCVYSETGCSTDFTFDYQNAATLNINSETYRTDTGSITVPANSAFTVSADNNYYITDVVDTTTGESVGSCSYCYNSFPIPDSNGHMYFYTDIDYSDIPSTASIVTIYDQRFILNANSPEYVKLVRNGMSDTYGHLIDWDLNNPPQSGYVWNLLEGSNFYNPVSYPDEQIPSLINAASESSPFMIQAKGSNSFFVKTKVNCQYSIECGHSYRVCMLNGNYTKPTKDWTPVNVIPVDIQQSEILEPGTDFTDYSDFYYRYNPVTQYGNGIRYAIVIINGTTYYLMIVDNC